MQNSPSRRGDALSKAEADLQAGQSAGNLHLIHYGPVHQNKALIDHYESFLLQEATVWDEAVLTEGLRQVQMSPQRSLLSQVLKAGKSPDTGKGPVCDDGEDQEDELLEQMNLQLTPSPSARIDAPSVTPSEQGETFYEQDNVILCGSGTLSPWDSDIDGREGETLSNNYDSLTEEDSEGEAVSEILLQGMECEASGWHRDQRQPTVQILTDWLQHWSSKDRHCSLSYRGFSNIQQWIQGVRQQDVQLTLPITVVSLQSIKQVECLEPLKNAISALVRAIRSNSPGGRIFVVNSLPNPRSAPVLGIRALEHNKLLFRAITTLTPKPYRVFYCDLAQHFVPSQGVPVPETQHFTLEGDLTLTGCFLFRSSVLREVGVVPYSI